MSTGSFVLLAAVFPALEQCLEHGGTQGITGEGCLNRNKQVLLVMPVVPK